MINTEGTVLLVNLSEMFQELVLMQKNSCLVLEDTGVLPSSQPPRSVRGLAWINTWQYWPLLKQLAQSVIHVLMGCLTHSVQWMLLLVLKMMKAMRGRQVTLAFILAGKNNYQLRSRAEVDIWEAAELGLYLKVWYIGSSQVPWDFQE